MQPTDLSVVYNQHLSEIECRECSTCGKLTVPSNSLTDICVPCTRIQFRECVLCKSLSISNDLPLQFNVCRQCTLKLCSKCNTPLNDQGKCASCSAHPTSVGSMYAPHSLRFRECGACSKYAIPKDYESWKNRCIDCLRNSRPLSQKYIELNFKACEKCADVAVPKADTWRRLCGPCYTDSKTRCKECDTRLSPKDKDGVCESCEEMISGLMRECSKCGLESIKYSAHSSVVICDACIALEDTRACQMCFQKVIPVSRPAWSKLCTPCFIQSKKGSK